MVLRATDVWLTRFLVQNGIAFYATWLTIAFNLNMVAYVTHRLNLDLIDVSTAFSSVITTLIIIYFIFETIIFPDYLKYTFSPWIAIIWSLIGNLSNQCTTEATTRNTSFLHVLLPFAFLLSLIKIINFIQLSNKKSMISSSDHIIETIKI